MPKQKQSRIEKEKKVVGLMVQIYCKKKHGHKAEICESCSELLNYAHKRLSHCKFGEEKSFCAKCPIQCYKKDMKLKVKEVMRFSGPRLIVHHPIEVIKHYFS